MDRILPEIDVSVCDGCGECLPACEAGALAVVESRAVLARPELCAYDARCEPACPVGAIALPYVVVFDLTPPASA